MSIYQLYGKVGPWAVPAPSAIALAGKVFGEWVNIDLGIADLNFIVAATAALFSLAALEIAGGLASYHAIDAGLKRRWGWFLVLAFGVVSYVILGIWLLQAVSAWVYVIFAVFTHIAVAYGSASTSIRTEVVEDKTLDLKFEQEKTKQLSAEARKAKAEATKATPERQVNDNDATNVAQSDTLSELSLKMSVRGAYDDNRDVNATQLARQLGVPEKLRTIQRWLKAWREEEAK